MNICKQGDCDRPVHGHGWCRTHYMRHRRGANVDAPIPKRAPKGSGWHNSHYGYRILTFDGKKIAEHRHVMEQALGRELTKDETVHHKNGDRQDNRLENLELWSSAQPSGQRVEDKISFALEILEQYAPQYVRRIA